MHVLAELARLRERIGRAKVPAMAAELAALDGRPSLVFAHHRSVVEDLARALEARGRSVGRVFGDRTQAQRQEDIDDFADGRLDTLVLTMGAGGEGLNMPRAEIVLITELDWGPSPFEQAIGRAQRPGRTTRLEIRYVVARDTLDAHMAETVVGKALTIALALGEDAAGAHTLDADPAESAAAGAPGRIPNA